LDLHGLGLSDRADPVPVAVVAFRGTSNPEEALEDLKSYKSTKVDLKAPIPEAEMPHFKAGSGFVQAYYDLRNHEINGAYLLDTCYKHAEECEGSAERGGERVLWIS
jgi:hypothetical protein